MNARSFVLGCHFLLSLSFCSMSAAEVAIMDFTGQPDGGAAPTPYDEDGIRVFASLQSGGAQFLTGNPNPGYALVSFDSGTAIYSLVGGGSFDLISIDLATPTNRAFTIEGMQEGGGLVIESVILAGSEEFTTVIPTENFTGLSSFTVGLPDNQGVLYMDNITLDIALPGDFNDDGDVNVTDIDMLCTAIRNGGDLNIYDLDDDGSIDTEDLRIEVEEIIETELGDSDVDSDVDLSDLGNLATNYEQPPIRTWGQGDFDCDGDVDLADLGTLATNYDVGQASAIAEFSALTGVEVPEPAAGLIWLGLLGLGRLPYRWRGHRRA